MTPGLDAGSGDGSLSIDGGLDPCFEPTTANETLPLQWDRQDDVGEVTITAPADPGGGYMEIVVATANEVVRPWIEVTTGDGSGVIVNGSSAGSAGTPNYDIPVRRVAFAVAPNQVYRVRAWEFFKAPAEAHPLDYTITWSFTSIADCYEPNDTPTEARPVTLGETITAYATAGYRTNSLDTRDFIDWYSFTLESEAIASAEMLVAPGSAQRMRIAFWDESGTTQLGTGGGNAGGELFTSSMRRAFPAGRYKFSVETATGQSIIDDNVPSIPESFTTPYQVRLTATAP